MVELAVKTVNLGKEYRIGELAEQNLRENFMEWVKNPFRKKEPVSKFWALRHQNLSIKKGESLALIGPNGSGKSTLLKLLARVTWPTEGEIYINGKVSALLEVGAGFHNELSGRENIFLNGAILGMKRAEVLEHFDEIVTFSGVERFLDTPLKHYSSGMFLRLAFSVMAHLKTEILIVDEILAVGDQDYQEKCMRKMHSLIDEGKTIIFVSHQLDKVKELCHRAIWIQHGEQVVDGSAEEVITDYQKKEFVGV